MRCLWFLYNKVYRFCFLNKRAPFVIYAMPETSDVEKDDRNGSRLGLDQQAAQNIPGHHVKQKEIPQRTHAKLESTRNAKTFIKQPCKREENLRPLPWPMPPKIYAHDSEMNPSGSADKPNEAESNFLTPQSSLEVNEDNASIVHRSPSTEANRAGSRTISRESSVRKESFSSVGTGFSSVLVDSSDDGSTESVSKVDIDADEFSRFLAEGEESKGAEVDFTNLFAEEDQEGRRGDSSASTRVEPHLSLQVSENSTTPKATRAPFLNHTGSGSGSNTVSLKEALNFSPDYKTIGPEYGRPYHVEKKMPERPEVQQSSQGETNPLPTANELNKDVILRRPMASTRAALFIPPPETDDTPVRSKPKASSNKGKLSSNETPVPTEATAPGKGVIMRAHHQVSHVAGIRRAETGRIMSREEMRARRPILLQESPNPKSLNPAGFMSEEEDISTVHPSTFLPSSNSQREANERAHQSTKSEASKAISPKQKSSGKGKASKVDDGSFLSPGILARKKKFGAEEYRVDSFQFSEHEGSSGLLNFFSSGLKKVHFGVGKKSNTRDATSQEGDSTIVVPGTIDETVCKICVVCRQNLEYDVYVKDTGKKIKVESRKDGRSRHLRATILVRQAPGESTCYVSIRQSRSDGMKTSLATLWGFYQRLEAGLKEMG